MTSNHAVLAGLIDAAFEEARKLDDDFVSVEHLVLALELVPRDVLLGALKEVRGGQRVTTQDPEGTYEALTKFGRDLTALAKVSEGKARIVRLADIMAVEVFELFHVEPRR